jgi:hypothetical protein
MAMSGTKQIDRGKAGGSHTPAEAPAAKQVTLRRRVPGSERE